MMTMMALLTAAALLVIGHIPLHLTSAAAACSLYLAPSSLPQGGLGIFAGRQYEVGDRLGQPTIGIPVTDPYSIYDAEELIAEYGWDSAIVGGSSDAEAAFAVLPGPAMMTNFHPSLGNVLPGALNDEPVLQRGRDAGAGASASYHNFTFVVKTKIEAGDEILASIGEDWFDFLREQKPAITVHTKAEYEAADKLVSSLTSFRRAHGKDTVTDAKFLDILLRIKTEITIEHEQEKNHHDNDNSLGSLVPLTLAAFHEASTKGTARAQLNERSLDWLRQNGRCLDGIRAGRSRIVDAGRGAFATVPIEMGSIITPIPLVQVTNNKTFETESIPDQNISKQQLLLNYCFGHRKASMLLCPTTAAALVNHNREKVNARVQWSDFPSSSEGSNGSPPPYMMTLDDIHPKRMGIDAELVFDLVATRDIAAGEEIYLDYGQEWEDAWNQYAENWNEKRRGELSDYVPASIMNKEQRPIFLSNDTNLIHHSYLCRLEPFAREESIQEMPVEDYRANPTMEPHSWNNFTRAMYKDNDYMWWWPCDVVDTDGESDSRTFRTVVYEKAPAHGGAPRIIRKLKNVPPSGIKFVDRPYHSNQHLSHAFRHYIPIPDDVFPLHWRDDYHTAESLHLGAKNTDTPSDPAEMDERLSAYEERVREAKCGVYVAPSNIKGAGYGVFLGVSMPGKGYSLGSHTPIVPVVDITSEDHWDASDYTWTASNFFAEYEAGYGGHVQIQIVNEGSMANFHPGLVNFQTSDVQYKPTLDRRTDPGAGAFSDYVDLSFESRHEVAAGEEIYISYGESWFSSRPYLGKIPLSSNYWEANKIVASLVSMSDGPDSGLDEGSATDLLTVVKENMIEKERTKGVLSAYQEFREIERVLARNGTAEATTENMSPEWLEENGYCTDNIYAKQSTIPQAGLGAFARRPIAKGDIIIPAPLLCTWGRHMFELSGDHVPQNYSTNTINLAYNYQYAHPNSSVLFFPVNTAITINHRSQRGWLGPKPNAELRWSRNNTKSMYYLQRPLEDLKEEHYATMVIDFVALRDIQPGEEITIDYGDEWDDEWTKHVADFQSPCTNSEGPCFKSSKMVFEMNNDKFNDAYHAWSEDHFTLCERKSMPSTDDYVIFVVPQTNDTDTSKDIVNVDRDGNEFHWSFRGVEFDHNGFDIASIYGEWYPCQILRAEKQDNAFDVVFFTYETSTVDNEANVLRRNQSLAADDIKYLNKPYKSDMHWDRAFRHEIKIPDEIYPVLWKDLVQ